MPTNSAQLQSASTFKGKVGNLRLGFIQAFGRMLAPQERSVLLDQWGVTEEDPAATQAARKEGIQEATAPLRAETESLLDQLSQMSMSHSTIQENATAKDVEISVLLSKIRELEKKPAVHPTFGALVHDFGYKQVYAATTGQLTELGIWEKQRVYSHQRASRIAKEKAKQGQPAIPGVITVYQDVETGVHAVLDGQHRIGALRMMAEEQSWPADQHILIEVFQTSNEAQIKDLFLEINKAEPLKLVDVPDAATPQDKAVLQAAVETLASEYPEMFKDSTRCRPPHVNADNLRDDLFQAEAATRGDVLVWLRECNTAMAEHFKPQKLKTEKKLTAARRKAIEKAQANGFYLGLDKRWLAEA